MRQSAGGGFFRGGAGRCAGVGMHAEPDGGGSRIRPHLVEHSGGSGNLIRRRPGAILRRQQIVGQPVEADIVRIQVAERLNDPQEPDTEVCARFRLMCACAG